jgi:hypothetical protein
MLELGPRTSIRPRYFKKGKDMKIEITEWQYEDEMTEESMYDALFPLSKVDFVRMFPKKIKIVETKNEKS